MPFDVRAWATFNGGLVVIGVVLVLAGIALAYPRPIGAPGPRLATWRTVTLRRTFGVAITGLGIVFALWGLAVVPF